MSATLDEEYKEMDNPKGQTNMTAMMFRSWVIYLVAMLHHPQVPSEVLS